MTALDCHSLFSYQYPFCHPRLFPRLSSLTPFSFCHPRRLSPTFLIGDPVKERIQCLVFCLFVFVCHPRFLLLSSLASPPSVILDISNRGSRVFSFVFLFLSVIPAFSFCHPRLPPLLSSSTLVIEDPASFLLSFCFCLSSPLSPSVILDVCNRGSSVVAFSLHTRASAQKIQRQPESRVSSGPAVARWPGW